MLEYGANKYGYWTGNHMILQFENCIDCLQVLYGERYDLVFFFDHSSGHAKKQVNGKDTTKMKTFHGRILQHQNLIKVISDPFGCSTNSSTQIWHRLERINSSIGM